jgi:hypothetical protein
MDRTDDAEEFFALVRRNPVNCALLDRLPSFGLPDVWLVAGALFQTVWNVASGNAPDHGIHDYDLFYFDDRDLSFEAEDRVIRRVTAGLEDLGVTVEIKNQARVHLWYGERFGPGYPALQSSRDGIDRFLVDCTRVGMQVSETGAATLHAPAGLTDLYAGVLRPNPCNHRPDLFDAKARSYQARWPWLRIEAALP